MGSGRKTLLGPVKRAGIGRSQPKASMYTVIDPTPYLEKLGDEAAALGLRAAKVVEIPRLGMQIPDRIFQASTGPPTVSTCTDLAVPIKWIWDVNYYYRALGFEFPYRGIGKKQLRKAYERLKGNRNDWLTYCLKQLLNRKVRAKYDAQPLGCMMDDYYGWLRVKMVAAEWARQQSMEQRIEVTAEDFLDNLGIKLPTQDEVEEPEQDPEITRVATDSTWPYGFFLWRSRKHDDKTLAAWQQLLIESFSRQGLRVQIAVGYVGGTHRQWEITSHQHHTIIFLNDDTTPTTQHADEAAHAYATGIDTAEPTGADASPHTTGDHMTSATEAEEDFFMTGGVAAAEDQEAERKARKAAFGKTRYFTELTPKSGDTVYIRWLMDDPQLLRTKQHSYVPTKPAPKDKPANVSWNDTMGAVCRYTKRADGQTTWFNDCYICDHMTKPDGKKYWPSDRVWGLAVVRKEVLGTQEMVDQGKIPASRLNTRVGFIDDLIEVDEVKDGKATGNKVKHKNIVVVNMAVKNFFGQFTEFYRAHGTLLDRDYRITRRGEKTDTEYLSVAMDPIMRPMKNEAGEVIGQEVFDLREPKFLNIYEDDRINFKELMRIARYQASDEFYARFFDRRVEVKWSDRDQDNDVQVTESKPEGSATAEPQDDELKSRLKAMRAKIGGENAPPEDAPMSEPVPEQAVPAPAPNATATNSLMDYSE